MNLSAKEKEYYNKTQSIFHSREHSQVLARLKELKAMGRADILPLVLDLLTRSNEEEEIKKEAVQLLCDVKEQKCAPIIVDYIREDKLGENLSAVLSSCWQSQLDYSPYLLVFVDNFIKGTYQESVEAFTVIEEMLWKAEEDLVDKCKIELKSRRNELDAEKEGLFNELVKILNEGLTPNREDYPDIYSE